MKKEKFDLKEVLVNNTGLNKSNAKTSSNIDNSQSQEVSSLPWNPVEFLTGFHHKLEDARNSGKPVNYIMGADGNVYEMRSTDLGDFIVKTNEVVGADKVEEGFKLNIPKMPFKLLLQAISFFRDVCDQFNQDEAMLQFWYDKSKKEFFPVCLEQTTNKVHVTFIRNQELEMNENMILVMDIHSHNTMSAFFSATDDASEQETRTYGVIGKLDHEIPEYKFRISVEGKFREVPLSSLFELPKVKVYTEDFEVEKELDEKNVFFPDVEYPKEWLDIIEEGKKNRQKFSGKGNLRPTRSKVIKPTGKYPSLGSLVDDPFTELDSASQMSLFDDKEYQIEALRNREGFGIMDDETVFQHPNLYEDSDFEDFADVLHDQLSALEDDPERRVELLSRAISDFSMFEVKMLIDRMLEIGYDSEIVDQLKNYGYKVSNK